MFTNILTYGRFATGLIGFFRHTLSLEESRRIVQRRLAERENNFLHVVEWGVFGYPRSPYLPLLKMVGCEMGDIRDMVQSRGLEKTLTALRESGVYFTFEEFKGRKPVVRNGKVVPLKAEDFDNPYLKHYYDGQSGGTTGVGTRVAIDLNHLKAQAPHTMLYLDAHGLIGRPFAIWISGLPDTAALNNILRNTRFGRKIEKWYVDVSFKKRKTTFKGRIGTLSIIGMGLFMGRGIPMPELVKLDEAIIIARWIAQTLKTHGSCQVHTYVSKALRVCVAAQEAGLDLTGTTFTVAGEPITPAKARGVEKAGALYVPSYSFTEHGLVGAGCVQPADENDIHFFKDVLALIQYPRKVDGLGIEVDAFLFTSLLTTAPKIMLNVESDDYGLIENRSCGCMLEACGFTEHLRHIRSFGKLTAGGPTLMGSDMVRILEEVLPNRFGGSPIDYQLVEEEDKEGITRFMLIISPKVQIPDEERVVRTVLENLSKGKAEEYTQGDTIKIKRMEPILTGRGKQMPLIPLQIKKNLANSMKD